MAKPLLLEKIKSRIGLLVLVLIAAAVVASGVAFMNYVRLRAGTAPAQAGTPQGGVAVSSMPKAELLQPHAESGQTLGAQTTNTQTAATAKSGSCTAEQRTKLQGQYDAAVTAETSAHNQMLQKLVPNALVNADAIEVEKRSHQDRLSELSAMLAAEQQRHGC